MLFPPVAENFAKPATIELEGKEKKPGRHPQPGFSCFRTNGSMFLKSNDYGVLACKPPDMYDIELSHRVCIRNSQNSCFQTLACSDQIEPA